MPDDRRDRRTSISLTREQDAQLAAIARALGTTRAALVSLWTSSYLRNRGLPPGGNAAGPPTDSRAQPANTAAWLPPTTGDADAWHARQRVRVVELTDRYPRQLEALPAAYEQDPIIHEAVWALIEFRRQLDAGEHDDPRMELAFNREVRSVAELLRHHRRRPRSTPVTS